MGVACWMAFASRRFEYHPPPKGGYTPLWGWFSHRLDPKTIEQTPPICFTPLFRKLDVKFVGVTPYRCQQVSILFGGLFGDRQRCILRLGASWDFSTRGRILPVYYQNPPAIRPVGPLRGGFSKYFRNKFGPRVAKL